MMGVQERKTLVGVLSAGILMVVPNESHENVSYPHPENAIIEIRGSREQ